MELVLVSVLVDSLEINKENVRVVMLGVVLVMDLLILSVKVVLVGMFSWKSVLVFRVVLMDIINIRMKIWYMFVELVMKIVCLALDKLVIVLTVTVVNIS